MDIDVGDQKAGKPLTLTITINGQDDGDITDGPPKKSFAQSPANVPAAPPVIPQAPVPAAAPPVAPPPAPPAPPPAAPPVTPLPAAPASSSDVDSNTKLQQLKPIIDKAAGLSGVDPSLLGAVMVKESRGVSIDAMKNAGGLMQLSSADFDLAKAKHPELNGLDPSSTEGQIMGTAFRLKDLKDKSGSWDGALTMYNGGENGNGHLNDPNYVTRVNEYQAIIQQGGQLPS
jgi:soluble lytic murein transglycosylase-like protein